MTNTKFTTNFFWSSLLYFTHLICTAKHPSVIMPYLQMIERRWCSVKRTWQTLSPQSFIMWPAHVLLIRHSYPSFETLLENFLSENWTHFCMSKTCLSITPRSIFTIALHFKLWTYSMLAFLSNCKFYVVKNNYLKKLTFFSLSVST
jgi:hypothetical protein